MKNIYWSASSFLLISLFCGCSETARYDVVIESVGLFDGEVDKGTVYVAINGDSIAAISAEPLEGDSTIDGTNKFIIPGMVNAHVHASSIEELKESFRFGILANLNMHTGAEERELEWKQMSNDTPGFPFLFGAGHAATVPGGHPSQFSPDMETINDSVSVEQWVDNRVANGADYIKIVRDNHPWMGAPPLPTLSYEQIGEIIDYAHSKGLLVVVHAVHTEDFLKIAMYEPDGFVHMWDYKDKSDLSDEEYGLIAGSGAFIVPTSGMSLKAETMDLPPFVKSFLDENILSIDERSEIIEKLHSNGVTIVAGTDAQSGQMNFGEDYYLELEMYKRAGLSNEEVLRTATGNAAKVFDLPVGLLHEGSKANFILLNSNPLDNLENLRDIEQVWKNGTSE